MRLVLVLYLLIITETFFFACQSLQFRPLCRWSSLGNNLTPFKRAVRTRRAPERTLMAEATTIRKQSIRFCSVEYAYVVLWCVDGNLERYHCVKNSSMAKRDFVSYPLSFSLFSISRNAWTPTQIRRNFLKIQAVVRYVSLGECEETREVITFTAGKQIWRSSNAQRYLSK